MGKYLDDAMTLYQQALSELERWQQTNDQVLLRDAAEKAWGAVTQAANEVLDVHGRVIPSGTGDRRSELRALERQDRRLRSLRLESRFGNAELILHRDCFYDGTCPPELVTDTVIESVKEYLDDVAEIVQDGRR
jgi:hypothetical protein